MNLEIGDGKKETLQMKELVKRLSEKGYTKRASTMIWQDVIEVMEEAFVEGNDVRFLGFGTFFLRDHKDRRSRHPGTGEAIIIPAHRTVVFVPGKRLKSELADGFVRK